jgi:hypothetical protein
MSTSSYRGRAVRALLLAILLSAASCAPENSVRKSAVPAAPSAASQTAAGAFPDGKATPGVSHVAAVLKALQDPARKGRRVTFEFSEAELNEYLAYSLTVRPRPGIRKVSVHIDADDGFSVRAVMDFAAIVKWHAWILPQAVKETASSEPVVEMDVKFSAHDGFGTFQLKRVQGLGGALSPEVAMWVIQAISLHQPEYYDTMRPIPLPFGLKRIWTGPGSVSGDTASQARRTSGPRGS